jgi:chemotaxis protein CheC
MEISEEVIDGIRELITIGVGHSAGMINELTKAHVTLTVPEVRIFDINHQTALSALDVTDPDESSQVILSFSGEYTGSLSLIIPYKSAIHLVILLTGEEGSPDEMDALRVETLIEVGNVVISSVMSSFSILLSSPLTFLYPVYRIGKWVENSLIINSHPKQGILARTKFQIQDREIEGFLFFSITSESFDSMQQTILEIMEKGL